jgi:hypothetical protein
MSVYHFNHFTKKEKYNPNGKNSEKAKLTEAFRMLRKEGFLTKQNFYCCRNCASYALEKICKERGLDPNTTPFVTYNRQDNANTWKPDGAMVKDTYLCITWGEDMDAHAKICKAFDAVGLRYLAPTSTMYRFEVLGAKCKADRRDMERYTLHEPVQTEKEG